MVSILGSAPRDRPARRVVIAGGGIMGAATAFFLTAPASPGEPVQVTVVERDPTYRIASSSLSASSIRQQFSQPVNIRLSRWSFDFWRDAARTLAVDGASPELGLVVDGYLYLATAGGAATLRQVHAVQRAEGVAVRLLDPAALQARFPALRVDDLALGALGEHGEGWFDGPGALQALRRKAIAQGARFVAGTVTGFDVRGDRVHGVRVARDDGATVLPADEVALCAGAWTAPLAALLGVDLPVVPRKRDVFFFTSPFAVQRGGGSGGDGGGFPLVVDPSGLWFRPEGRGWLCGGPPRGDDPDAAPLEVDHGLFDEVLWPALAQRVPAFEAARVASSWAGYYEFNTFDANGVVGRLPGWPNAWTACGFSGHGLQQAPAVGCALSDALRGAVSRIDAGDLSPQRLVDGQPLREHNVI
jgi:glycine/D-amino acid oxidase-like deaminating enzyme